MAKIKKIPTHQELKEQREQQEKEREERAKKHLIQFLQDNTLKAMFHLYLGLEYFENIKVTEDYNRNLKLHGNRFLKELEKTVTAKIDVLYPEEPEFTTNMMQQLDEIATEFSTGVLFADMPIIVKMIQEFKKDPENFRKNTVMKFNKLDA